MNGCRSDQLRYSPPPNVLFRLDQTGVQIPASALVLSASQPWAYVQTKPGTFLRVPVDMSKPVPGGYFQAAGGGIASGQAIVTSGAGLLLARETNPSTEPEE